MRPTCLFQCVCMCVHVCLCVCSLLRFNLFFVSLTALSPSAFCSTEQQTTFILPSVNERDSERGRERERERDSSKWNKIKIKQHKRSCWLVASQPCQLCAGYYWLQAAERWGRLRLRQPGTLKMNIWADLLWQAVRADDTFVGFLS